MVFVTTILFPLYFDLKKGMVHDAGITSSKSSDLRGSLEEVIDRQEKVNVVQGL